MERVEIARRALTLAAQRIGADPERDAVTVVGDTPADVRCGHAIGARTMAVASGAYSREQLKACAPSVVLDRFPPPRQFEAMLTSPSA